MWDVVFDALIDTLKLFPFLLLAYIVIELLEQKTDLNKPHGRLSGRLAPLIGGATGLIPQCGFSVMAAKLYERRHITAGTLFAVFIATSDEAFVILLSSGRGAIAVMPMIAVKIIVGVGAGYLADFIIGRTSRSDTHHACEHIHEEESEEAIGCCHSCGREHDGKSPLVVYFVAPLLHALKVAAYILLVNLLFGFLFYAAGEERVVGFLQEGIWIQPLIAALIGLIPNCASSVVLTEAYLLGGITFGSCLAGLCANAGLGMLVLFRNVKAWKRNLIFVAALYLVGIGVGYAVNAIALAIA